MNGPLDEHAWVRERLEAYFADGLTPEERAAVEKHADGCAECGAALRALAEVDGKMQALFAEARPAEDFEHRIIARLWHAGMRARISSPTKKRVRFAIAASLLLGTSGIFANYAVENNVLSNPMSGLLADSGNGLLPAWFKWGQHDRKTQAHGELDKIVAGADGYRTPLEASPGTAASESPADRKIQETLGQNIPEIDADQQPLERVIDYLRNSTDTNISVDWAALEKAGINRNTPVSMKLHDVPYRQALATVLASAGGKGPLDYTIDDGVISISTKGKVASPPETDVNKLMGEAQAAYASQQYGQAKQILDRVLREDPQNTAAKLFSEITQDRVAYVNQNKLGGHGSHEITDQSIMNEKELIPYHDLLIYPEDWPELSRRQGGGTSDTEIATPANASDVSGKIDDSLQTNLLLRATQADRKTTTVTAPRITLYNGQAGYIAAGNPAQLAGGFGGGGYSNDGDGSGPTEARDPNAAIHGRPGTSPKADVSVAFHEANVASGDLTKIGSGNVTFSGTGGSTFGGSGAGGGRGGGGPGSVPESWRDRASDLPSSGGTVYSWKRPADVVLNAGTLILGNNSALGGPPLALAPSSPLSVATGATLGGSGTVAGKGGSSTWSVSSNYTGGTAVRGGTVTFNTDLPVGDSVDNIYTGDRPTIQGRLSSGSDAQSGAYDIASVPVRVGTAGGGNNHALKTQSGGAASNGHTPDGGTPDNEWLAGYAAAPGKVDTSPSKAVAVAGGQPAGPAQGSSPTAPSQAAPPPAPGPDAAAQAAASNQKIIRTGTMEFEVSNFDDAAATITSVVTEQGGFVAGTDSQRLTNGKMKGTITIRVAPERLDRVVLELRGLGELKTKQITAQDITKEYTDLESELRADNYMEQRMLDIIKNGKGEIKDLVEAERQLGIYRSEIEKIEGEKRYYDNQVALSTLSITLYEKDIQAAAAASEMENVTMGVETEDVESKFSDAKDFIEKDAGGRIIKAELKKYDADQLAAQIVCEVPPEKADFLITRLKQLGKVAQLDRDRSEHTQDGQATVSPNMKIEQKNTQISLSLYNLTSVAPRETAVLVIAVPNVEMAYNKVLNRVRQDIHTDKPPEGAPKPVGVVQTSNLSGQQVDQMVADIHADVRAGEAPAVLADIRALGGVMSSTLTENPDTANVTTSKEGIQLRLVAVAAVPPRETQTLQVAAADVPSAYAKLMDAVRPLLGEKGGRVLQSQLNQQDQSTVTGVLDVEVPRDSQALLDAALAATGADVVARNVVRSTDTLNTLDSKVRYAMSLVAADSLPPKENSVIGLEVQDVEKSMGDIRAAVAAEDGRELDASKSKDTNGNVMARMLVDVPIGDSPALLIKLQGVGKERTNEIAKNPQGESGKLARARYDITLTAAGSLPAKENATIALQVDDVERALSDIQAAVAAGDGRELDSAKSKDPSGRELAQIIVEVPIGASPGLLAKLEGMGKELANKITTNPQGEDGKLSRAQYDITLSNMAALVPENKTIASTLRAAVSTSLGVLFWSLYLIFTGIMMAGPWLLILWVVWRVIRRKKKVAA